MIMGIRGILVKMKKVLDGVAFNGVEIPDLLLSIRHQRRRKSILQIQRSWTLYPIVMKNFDHLFQVTIKVTAIKTTILVHSKENLNILKELIRSLFKEATHTSISIPLHYPIRALKQSDTQLNITISTQQILR